MSPYILRCFEIGPSRRLARSFFTLKRRFRMAPALLTVLLFTSCGQLDRSFVGGHDENIETLGHSKAKRFFEDIGGKLALAPSGAEPMAAGFSTIYQETLAVHCVECHNPSGMATVDYNVQLNFSSRMAAYTTLLASKVNGTTSTGACGPVNIVVPGNPNTSYLVATLISTYSTGRFGGIDGCIPYTGHYASITLSFSQQQNLISWIRQGARDN